MDKKIEEMRRIEREKDKAFFSSREIKHYKKVGIEVLGKLAREYRK